MNFNRGAEELRRERKPPRRQPRPITLIPFDEIELDDEPDYLVDGLVPAEGLTVVWGPPKCSKSFIVFDMTMHLALGRRYRGRAVQQCPVVYCAFEGGRGFKKRVVAFKKRHLSEHRDPVPFYLQPLRLDLIAEAGALVDAISGQLGDTKPGAIVLDTLNRSLVGSESKDEDMTAYLAAADQLREAFDCAVIIVHHCGVDGSRPRGHTSVTGAADAQLAVKRNGEISTLTVEFMKDGREGDVVASRLDTVVVGQDRDGLDLTSCVVVPAELPEREAAKVKLTKNQQTMFSILHNAKRLSTDEWHDQAKAAGLGVKRRSDLYDLKDALKDKGLVSQLGDHWTVRHED